MKKCQEVFHSSPTAFSSCGAFYSYPLGSQLALQNRSNAIRVVTAPAFQQVVRIFRAIQDYDRLPSYGKMDNIPYEQSLK